MLTWLNQQVAAEPAAAAAVPGQETIAEEPDAEAAAAAEVSFYLSLLCRTRVHQSLGLGCLVPTYPPASVLKLKSVDILEDLQPKRCIHDISCLPERIP